MNVKMAHNCVVEVYFNVNIVLFSEIFAVIRPFRKESAVVWGTIIEFACTGDEHKKAVLSGKIAVTVSSNITIHLKCVMCVEKAQD